MFKKLITAAVAALMLATVAAPALACGKDGTATDNPFKTLNREINTLRAKLNHERALDQALYAKIKNTRKLAQVDKAQYTAYRAELDPLTAQLKTQRQQLKEAIEKKDTAKQTELGAAIGQTVTQIAAVKAKYADIVKAIHNHRKTVCDVKAMKEQVEPKYAELKTLVDKAATINAAISTLMKGYKDAVKAGDTAKQADLLAQLTTQKTDLAANLTARVALRTEITNLLKQCLFKIY